MENTANQTAASKSGDKVKRDEWSEGAVSSLLEAYEAKWVLRNRAKLKGQDWIEVARFVSTTAEAPKTHTQCKNKIESMKKRYRSESAAAGGSASTWPFYETIHLLLRGNKNHTQSGGGGGVGVGQIVSRTDHQTKPINTNTPSAVPVSVQFPIGQNVAAAASALEPNGVVFSPAKEEDGVKLSQSDQVQDTTDNTSTNPAFNIHRENKLRTSSSNTRKRKTKKMKMKKNSSDVIAESVRWLAESVVRMEEARMKTMRDLERMRAEAEIRRGELELKRTQIIADTQLEIARLLSGKGAQGTTPPGPS